MDAAHVARFSGQLLPDLVALTVHFGELRSEVEGLPGISFDRVSVCANDGETMYANFADTEASEVTEADIGRFPVLQIIEGLERIETECLILKREPSRETARRLADMDHEVVQLFQDHADAPRLPSSVTAVHAQFTGKKGTPVWSAYVENDTLRSLACGADARHVCAELFRGGGADEDGEVVVHFADRVDACLPLGVFMNRRLQQLRAQCLNPPVVLVASRGVVISSSSAQRVSEIYDHIIRRISTFSTSHHGTHLFEKPYDLAGPQMVLGAEKALYSCLEDVPVWHSWTPDRGSDLHQLLCSPPVLALLRQGFPTEPLVQRGGGAPLVVDFQKNMSTIQLGRNIQGAWEEYRKRYVDELRIVPPGKNHVPRIVLIEGVSAITLGASEDELARAYAVLQESIVLMKGAAPFGGLRALSDDHQQLILLSVS